MTSSQVGVISLQVFEFGTKRYQKDTRYFFEGITLSNSAVCASVTHLEMIKIWHMRLGHKGDKGCNYFPRQVFYLQSRQPTLIFLKNYVFGRKHRTKFRKGVHIIVEVLDYIHSDCRGSSRVEDMRGFRYFVTFVGDKFRFT